MVTVIKDEAEVTDTLINYIASEVQKVTDLNDFEIENYSDQEILNPEMQEYLKNFESREALTVEQLEGAGEFLTISSLQSIKFNASSAAALFGLKFRKLKRIIRKVFCEVVAPMLGDNGEINLKDVIKAVLIALIPALAGSGGLAILLLPIVIAIIAKLLKRGVDTVCPVN